MEPEDPRNPEEDALRALDRLLEYVDGCPRFPPGYPVVLADHERLFDFAAELRLSWEDPIALAREVEDRIEAVVSAAHTEAGEVASAAEARAEQLVAAHPLTVDASRRAAALLEAAERRAAEVLHLAEESAAGDLRAIQARAEAILDEVRRGERVLAARLGQEDRKKAG